MGEQRRTRVRVASGAAILRHALGDPDVVEDHLRRLIREMLWSATESDGK